MRYSSVLFLVSLLSFVSAASLFEPSVLEKRLGVATGNVACLSVGILSVATCICIDINAGGTVLNPSSVPFIGTLAQATVVTAAQLALANAASASVCVYSNTNADFTSIPSEGSTTNSGSCQVGGVCPAPTCVAGTVQCGLGCYPAGTACSSGVPSKKRAMLEKSKRGLLCPAGKTACGLPESLQWVGKPYECIDVQSDIESCGACAFPLKGEVAGEDCTAIAHSSSVSCVKGQCQVNACAKGFTVQNGTACVEEVSVGIAGKRTKSKRTLNDFQLNSRSA